MFALIAMILSFIVLSAFGYISWSGKMKSVKNQPKIYKLFYFLVSVSVGVIMGFVTGAFATFAVALTVGSLTRNAWLVVFAALVLSCMKYSGVITARLFKNALGKV